MTSLIKYDWRMAEIKESCYCNFDALKSALLRVVKRGKKVIISRLGGVESELKKKNANRSRAQR